jgi:hypothetical protein
MNAIEVPVGDRFLATNISVNEGEDGCIAVECESTSSTSKCSQCALYLKGCSHYLCMPIQRKDGKSVYFKVLLLCNV